MTKRYLMIALCALLFKEIAFSQSNEAVTGPIAYVYVTDFDQVDAYSVALNGKLTPLKSTPGSYTGSVANKRFFFGFDGKSHISTYAIALNGTLGLVATTNVIKSSGWCYSAPPLAMDTTPIEIDSSGETIYVPVADCQGSEQRIESFAIENDGHLKYLGTSALSGDAGEIVTLGNDKFGYVVGCAWNEKATFTRSYKRQPDGLMTSSSASFTLPYHGCPNAISSDSSDHLALAWQDVNDQFGTQYLASYTVNSNGNATTTNSIKEMAQANQNGNQVSLLKISPNGEFIAVGGSQGFQVFHFNGSEPITHPSAEFDWDSSINQMAWDNNGHLFAISFANLFVDTVTSTSITSTPGSPHENPQHTASSIVVVPLTK